MRHPFHRVTAALAVSLACTAVATAAPRAPPDPELLRDLLQWAAKLTGITAPDTLPTLTAVSEQALARRVCPDEPRHCRTLIAVYDTDRTEIVYRDSLDLRDETDQSYIVHELVHYLQHRRDGDALFADCPRVMQAETEAYAAQNRYLTHFRQWRRVGEMLRFTHCPDLASAPRVTPGEPAALTSRSPQGR
ncbi:MAG: hypothetical protein RL489_1984 [Pseudomonadota bacterium]|jgi:hypothetical protein